MLSSLCPVMAANLSVSYFRFGHLASVPVAGSIGTWIVARLYSEWPLCGRTTTNTRRQKQEGAASGRRLHGRRGALLSADTSVPKQREGGLGEFEPWLPDAMLRDASAGMAFLDIRMRFAWVNPALAGLYDRPAADFVGRPVTEVWPEVVALRAEAAMRQLFPDGRPATATVPHQPAGPPGERIFHWFGVTGPDGALCGAGLIVIAGGTGPATQEALRRSEERYRALVQGGAQIIWVSSPSGEMLEDSAEWRWITGQTVEEFLGNGWLDSIHPEDRERVERDWRDCLSTGRLFDERFRMRTRGGSYRHLSLIHISEPTRLGMISYAVFCLKKQKK